MRTSTVPARLPAPVAVSVALGRAEEALLAIGGAGGRARLHLHQTLGGKADHLAQQIGVRALLHERAQVHHVVGDRWPFQAGVGVATRPYRKAPMTTALPPTPRPGTSPRTPVGMNLPSRFPTFHTEAACVGEITA